MFEHLCNFVPPAQSAEDIYTPDEKATPVQILEGKIESSAWLESFGVDDDETIDAAQQVIAREAFVALTVPMGTAAQKTAIAKIEVPEAVKQLVGMLTAYDWAFVEQAKEIRGYCVAKLLDESVHPDAKYRLRAIELLGKVTEVALFTERVEVKKAVLNEEELEEQIKSRMGKYMELLRVVEPETTVEPEV